MISHDPITPKQEALLERMPIDGTDKELIASGDYADLNFLNEIGLATIRQTHLSVDQGQSRYRYAKKGSAADVQVTPTHDPITPAQVAFLDTMPVEDTDKGLQLSGRYADLSFLTQLGYLTIERTHLSVDQNQSRYRYTRTEKPLEK